MPGGHGRRSSLSKLSSSISGSRTSLIRRSARQLGPITDHSGNAVEYHHHLQCKQLFFSFLVHFAQYRPVHWFLKPLFFEVPQRESSCLFVGRQWLYSEISSIIMEEISSSKGVMISGKPGSGKTAVILQLVENSCFGRGQSGLAGKIFPWIKRC